jgi:hypothetical protein
MKETLVFLTIVLSLLSLQTSTLEAQEKKAKAEKVTGDVGLLDSQKNYMIVVTKEGKLVTIDFNDKTKVTKYVPEKAKMSDINLGESASITYKKVGDKNIIDSMDVTVKAKKGE